MYLPGRSARLRPIASLEDRLQTVLHARGTFFKYRAEIAALARHGLPDANRYAELVRDFVRDLYKYKSGG